MTDQCTASDLERSICAPGILDCCYLVAEGGRQLLQCADYGSGSEYLDPHSLKWIPGVAFGTMALMAYGIGANDVGNAFGTSVGSGAISLRRALVIGGLMDWLGAATLGAGVSNTIRSGVSDIQRPDCWACGYCDSRMSLYMLGMAGALLATAVFLILSSTTSMPVSTTHAVIGAIAGMTAMGVGVGCLKLGTLVLIAVSWVSSPLLAGIIGAGLYVILQRTILQAPDADQRAMLACPWLAALSTAIMAVLVLLKSHLTEHLPWYWALVVAAIVFALTMVVSYYVLVPHIQRQITASQVDSRVTAIELAAVSSPNTERAPSGADRKVSPPRDRAGLAHQEVEAKHLEIGLENVELVSEEDENEWDAVLSAAPAPATAAALPGMFANEEYSEAQRHALFVFRYLLVFMAALESFAHGANDTGNATGAFSATWMAYQNGLTSCNLARTPSWVMIAGGGFVFLGVCTMGHRVIQTMGFGLANINFLRGFCIEFASTASVVAATILGIPVSTTHCQVGAVIFVGWTAFGAKHVKWSLFGWIALTWLVTVPAAAGLAALALLAGESIIKR